MSTPDRIRETRGPTGWVMFAGSIMVIVGFLNFFYGLAAIVNDQVVVVGGHGAIIADLTAWGWVTLLLSLVLVMTGFGLFSGATWARVVGIVIVLITLVRWIRETRESMSELPLEHDQHAAPPGR